MPVRRHNLKKTYVLLVMSIQMSIFAILNTGTNYIINPLKLTIMIYLLTSKSRVPSLSFEASSILYAYNSEDEAIEAAKSHCETSRSIQSSSRDVVSCSVLKEFHIAHRHTYFYVYETSDGHEYQISYRVEPLVLI